MLAGQPVQYPGPPCRHLSTRTKARVDRSTWNTVTDRHSTSRIIIPIHFTYLAKMSNSVAVPGAYNLPHYFLKTFSIKDTLFHLPSNEESFHNMSSTRSSSNIASSIAYRQDFKEKSREKNWGSPPGSWKLVQHSILTASAFRSKSLFKF